MLDAQIMSHVTKSVHKVKELEKGLMACKKAPNTESTANKTQKRTRAVYTRPTKMAPHCFIRLSEIDKFFLTASRKYK